MCEIVYNILITNFTVHRCIIRSNAPSNLQMQPLGCIFVYALNCITFGTAIDRYEGYPHFYYKTELELPLAETGKKLTAFVYIMHEERKLGIPTSAYIRTCVDGSRQFGFNLKHLRKAMDISEREVYHHENG